MLALRAETCVRVAAARGLVLMRSWAADASSAVLSVRDASFEPWTGLFRGRACSHQPRSSEAQRHASCAARLRLKLKLHRLSYKQRRSFLTYYIGRRASFNSVRAPCAARQGDEFEPL